jgi:hypothetical protein
VTLVPASQARRIARRSSSTSPPHTPCEPTPNACRSESSRQSGRTGQRAQTAMACADWSRALATSQVMGNQASGSTWELAHRASRYTRPASSRSVRSCGSGRTRRGLEAVSPGCTSCPSASFIAPSSPLLRRPASPVRLVEEAVRDARGAGHGAEHHVRRDNPANLAIPRGGAAAHEDPGRGGPEGTDPGAANGLSWGAGLSDLIAALAPRAVTLPGRVMWLRTASSSLVTKRTSEQERWTDEDRQ